MSDFKPSYKVLLGAVCANDVNDDNECIKVIVDFGTEENYIDHLDSLFDDLIHLVNGVLPKNYYVDDVIETIELNPKGKADLIL